MTQTTRHQDPSIAQGLLLRCDEGMIVLGLPGTDYQLRLQSATSVEGPLNEKITGRVHARAKRVDVVRTGGRFIEPVYGRPRRLQGRIVAVHPQDNAITVHCGCPFICELTMNQKATDFTVGLLVGFDVERGAVFEQVKLDPPPPE